MYFQEPGTCCPLILLVPALPTSLILPLFKSNCGVTVTIRAMVQFDGY